ncbi:hypothetical protein V499_03777 [Pseudogymnoascus sp. VKM F-103]|nr:hypothetical protein V499_03777 [Pseudogymnoascus sp. VKM F-103]
MSPTRSVIARYQPARHVVLQGLLVNIPKATRGQGIPSGYISSLEERLIETEIALFEALSFINTHFHQGGNTQFEPSQYHDAFTNHSTALSKQAKVEEWKRLPLTFEDQQKAWLQEKLHVASRTDYRNDSISESPGSQETEHPWPGSPPTLFARHNEEQLDPRRQSLAHSENAQGNQEVIQADYQPVMHDNESLQVGPNYTSPTLETPQRTPVVNAWTNRSSQQRTGEAREGDGRVYDSYLGEANLQFLDDQRHSPRSQTITEQVPMGLNVPSSLHDRQISVSSGLGRHSLEARKVSSKEWQRYF